MTNIWQFLVINQFEKNVTRKSKQPSDTWSIVVGAAGCFTVVIFYSQPPNPTSLFFAASHAFLILCYWTNILYTIETTFSGHSLKYTRRNWFYHYDKSGFCSLHCQKSKRQCWWFKPVIPALGRHRREDQKFKVICSISCSRPAQDSQSKTEIIKGS